MKRSNILSYLQCQAGGLCVEKHRLTLYARVIFKHSSCMEKLLLLCTIQLGNCLCQVLLVCRYKEHDDVRDILPSTLLFNLHFVRGARKEYILNKKRSIATYT